MIGHEMGSSLARVNTTAKTSPVETFKHEWKNDMDANMDTFICYGSSQQVKIFWTTSGELQLEAFPFSPSCLPHQPWPQITYNLG